MSIKAEMLAEVMRKMAGGALATGALASQEAEAGPVKVLSHLDEAGNAVYKTVIDAWHGGPHTFKAERKVRMSDGTERYIEGGVDRLPAIPDGAEVLQDYPLGRIRGDKTGTGEGAAAYGHGLGGYHADSENVAKGYRDGLQYKAFDIGEAAKARGIPLNAGGRAEVFRQVNANPNATPQEIARKVGYANAASRDIPADELAAFIGDYQSANKGSLYRTELDVDPDTLLDWDKPLSEQSVYPQENIKDMAKRYKAEGKKAGLKERLLSQMEANKTQTGEQFYNNLLSRFDGDQAKVSAYMKEAGIPGIRYKDGMSRGADGGTSNYVMFDDSKISIKERGAANPMLLGGVAATTAAAMRAAQQKDNKSVIKSPQNPITAKLAMALRDGERAIKGSPAELMYPSGLAPWLERLAYKEKPSKMERAMAIADFL